MYAGKPNRFIQTELKPDDSVKPFWPGRPSADDLSHNQKFSKFKTVFNHNKVDYESIKPFWGRPIAELSPNHKSRPFVPTIASSKTKADNKTLNDNKPFWGLPISELSPKHFMNRQQEMNSIDTTKAPATGLYTYTDTAFQSTLCNAKYVSFHS